MATKSRKSKKQQKSTKKAICVRMEGELYDAIMKDADEGERSPPAQVRLVLKEHYGFRD